MASKVKNIKQSNNILYLQDSDAKALGIIEGASQRVFIDNREVEVVFVDEHEVLPVSNEEKKLYEEAYKIASKYVENSSDNSTPTSRSLVQRSEKYKEPRPVRREQRAPGEGFSFKKQWNSFIGLFRREPSEHEGPTSRDIALAERAARREEREYIEARNQQKRHAKHSIRNDIFTEEELEIIQNVIDKSKHPSSSSKVKSKKK